MKQQNRNSRPPSTSYRETDETEKRRFGEKEKQSNGDSHATEGSEEMLPLAACVPTLPKAVEISLSKGMTPNCLFIFARALKAFEITTGVKLKPRDLQGAFALWWNTAQALLPAGADFDEYRFSLEDSFAKVRAPWGADPLAEAVLRADATPLVPHVERYQSLRIKRLIAVGYHLQVLNGDCPFFLSVRDAARIAGITDLTAASSMLSGLVRDGVLAEVEKGVPGGRRASRYRFNSPSPSRPTPR